MVLGEYASADSPRGEFDLQKARIGQLVAECHQGCIYSGIHYNETLEKIKTTRSGRPSGDERLIYEQSIRQKGSHCYVHNLLIVVNVAARSDTWPIWNDQETPQSAEGLGFNAVPN